ncbi:MAG: hypothetical protein K2Y32_14485 [Candidatus Obscuribacterales bacterium]|nr:hypothetical protein [Candidatus Obscuribacterales bacterium]
MLKSPADLGLSKNQYREAYGAILQDLWMHFEKLFPTEDSCWCRLLVLLKERKLLFCRNCHNDNIEIKAGKRKFRCSECHMHSSVTAGTFFHRVRKLRAWFAAIWFSENGALICSTTFARFLQIAQSSALHIVKSVKGAIDLYCSENVDSRLPVSTVHFIELFDRRSMMTNRLMAPYFEDLNSTGKDREEQAFDSPESNTTSSKDSDGIADPALIDSQDEPQDFQSLSETDSLVLSSLNHGSMTIDEIAAFAGLSLSQVYDSLIELELSGEIELKPGGRFVLREAKRQFKIAKLSSSSNGSNSNNAERYWWELIDSESAKLLWQEFIVRGKSEKIAFETLEEEGHLRNLPMWQIAKARKTKRERKDLSPFGGSRCDAVDCTLCTTANGAAVANELFRKTRSLISILKTLGIGSARKHIQLLVNFSLNFIETIENTEKPTSSLVEDFGGSLTLDSREACKNNLFDVCLSHGYLGSPLLRATVSPAFIQV